LRCAHLPNQPQEHNIANPKEERRNIYGQSQPRDAHDQSPTRAHAQESIVWEVEVDNHALNNDADIERKNCADGSSSGPKRRSAKMTKNEGVIQNSIQAVHEENYQHVDSWLFKSGPVTVECV